jgi:hypothetical protein
VKPTKALKHAGEEGVEADGLRASFRRMERREWWLWGMAFTVTLLVTLGLSSFVAREAPSGGPFFVFSASPGGAWAGGAGTAV